MPESGPQNTSWLKWAICWKLNSSEPVNNYSSYGGLHLFVSPVSRILVSQNPAAVLFNPESKKGLLTPPTQRQVSSRPGRKRWEAAVATETYPAQSQNMERAPTLCIFFLTPSPSIQHCALRPQQPAICWLTDPPGLGWRWSERMMEFLTVKFKSTNGRGKERRQ